MNQTIQARDRVIYNKIEGGRERGVVIMHAKGEGFWVIRPENKEYVKVVSELDIISKTQK